MLGFLCRAFPPAVAVGLGMRPVRAVAVGSEKAGEALVRPDLCPFVKSVLGGVATGAGVFGTVDAWAGMYTCDMTRRLFQELERMTGKPVFPLQLPATRSPAGVARWPGPPAGPLSVRFPGSEAGTGVPWANGPDTGRSSQRTGG